MKKVFTFMAAAFSLFYISFAEPKTFNNPGPMPEPKEKGRPTVALVLSGGGINGAAEIPVLEEIDRLGIPVDMIFGTSVGSIVGGLYAAGYTTDMIYELFFTQNWPEIFADFSPSPYEQFYEEHGYKNNLFPVRTGLDAKLQIGKGITNGQKAYQMLKELTLKYPSNLDFDKLPIPFRAIATDMITGEPYLFSQGDLAEAIRASMNVAGLFEPLYIEGHYLLDGGLTYNMPVSLAKKMGYDIVIAVEIGPSSNKTARIYDTSPLYALQDSIYIPMKTIDKMEAQKADLYLEPDMSRFDITDFEKAKAIYDEGVKAVLSARDDFEKLKNRIYPKGKTVQTKENLYSAKEDLKPAKLVTLNGFKEDEKFFQKQFKKYQNSGYTREAFRIFLNSVYSTGHYKLALSKFIEDDGNCIMELTLSKKPSPTIVFLTSADLKQTITEQFSSFANVNFALQFRDFSGADSLLSLRGTFLNDWKIDTLYFQPFNRNCYMTLQSKYACDIFGTYKEYMSWQNKAGIGLNYVNNTFYENGLFCNLSQTPVNFYSKEKQKDWDAGLYFRYNFTLVDQPCFSQKGFIFDSTLKYIVPVTSRLNFDAAALLGEIKFKSAIPFGDKVSLVLNGLHSFDFTGNLEKNYGLTALEGKSNYNRIYFPQIAEQDYFSSFMLAGSISLQFAPVDHLTIAGGKVYLIANGTWGTLKNLQNGNWTVSTGLGIRFIDSFNVLLRIGTGSIKSDKIIPFATLDIGALKF